MVHCYQNFWTSNNQICSMYMYTNFSKNMIYSIIGTGMRLYEKRHFLRKNKRLLSSDRGVSCFLSIFLPLCPRRALNVVYGISNLILVLTCLTTTTIPLLPFSAYEVHYSVWCDCGTLSRTPLACRWEGGQGCLFLIVRRWWVCLVSTSCSVRRRCHGTPLCLSLAILLKWQCVEPTGSLLFSCC